MKVDIKVKRPMFCFIVPIIKPPRGAVFYATFFSRDSAKSPRRSFFAASSPVQTNDDFWHQLTIPGNAGIPWKKNTALFWAGHINGIC